MNLFVIKSDSWLQKKFEILFQYNNEVKAVGKPRKMFNDIFKRSKQRQKAEISKIYKTPEMMYLANNYSVFAT